ncbi:GNAT family N-acetyltransferase [Kribbella italica]|uniref:RimJ/RimL family protein N-acetyltransferase n=1 Tax=Kribbella italica TaxID=1540520 RepID=A0A7W9J0T3_9ACTN|nr:GNAT family N-acetyltransferase [Kribbella italica]MBB5833554.1 RimJ/RimL family protein N-acetyltransferase [Kribbella italica]
MLLRPMLESDLDELLVVQEEGAVLGLGAVFPQESYPFPRDSIRERWALEIGDPVIRAWVALDGGRLAGFAATRYDQLLHFGTAVPSWGSGLASELHDAVIDGLRADWPAARLHVFEGNQRARRFYAKHGWVATGSSTRSAFPPRPVLLDYRLEFA